MASKIKKVKPHILRKEYENVQISYDSPMCEDCKSIQTITNIDISKTHVNQKYLGTMTMKIELRCDNSSCDLENEGFIKNKIFKLYNPDTHKIEGKKEKKND